ncbi:MAG: CoA-binding protein [Dehalococcoidia bacterium]|nr:CoA-binding protein [Dehalococcoidia bacterium]
MPLSDSSREPSLEYAFHPRSMAVVGLSPDPHGTWLNRMYLQAPLEAGFKGPIYPVNRKGGHIGHIRVYTSLSEVPEPPDYVVSCIPAQQTPDLLEECRAVGVKVLQLYTAGFTETGLSSGIKLQDRLLEIARRARIRLIGPNCMGVYCPDWGMSFSPDLPKEPGNIGFLCQSGGNAVFLIRSAAARGLRFSKGISYGNACDVNECDILEYLADDRGTKVIAAYIEGTSDGRRFADVLSRAAAVKPVVVYKGGYTEAGGRAAASHTGAMAGSEVIWDGIIRQTGAIRVNSIEEMIDMLVALVQMKRPKGLNTCVVGIGGGASVVATDEMEKAGLRLPPIPPSIQERMAQIIPPAGGMLRNPIDAFPLSRLILYKKRAQGGKSGNAHAGDKGWSDFMSLLENWPDIDAVIFHFPFDTPPVPASNWAAATVEPVLTAVRTCHLPSAVVFHSIVTDASWRESRKMQAICLAEEIPFFLSLKGAAESIAHLHQAGQIAKIWSVEKQH